MDPIVEKDTSVNVYASDLPPNQQNYALEEFEKQDRRYKRQIRILRFISRVVSFLLSGFMLGSMAFALAKFLLTKNMIINGHQHPWAQHTTIWPTLMLLAIAAITLFMNFIVICAYICGVGIANKASSFMGYVGYILSAAHIIAWAVATGLFKMANTGNDLWGYSCSDKADAIQMAVQNEMNFGTLCTVQTGSWYSSIIETLTYLLNFALTMMVFRRAIHKKKLTRMRINTTASEF